MNRDRNAHTIRHSRKRGNGEGVRAAGSTSGDNVAAALRSGRFETVIGAFRFDAKGDVDLPPYAVYQWSKGRYEQLLE